jgi:hypothetical protein
VPYNHITYSEFCDLLAVRLGDEDKVFFIPDELKRLTLESLRFWNSAAQYHRDRGSFSTTSNTPFYDLNLLDKSGTKLLSRAVTDQSLCTEIKYSLLEPNPTDQTTFTEMFTASALTNALEKRRNQFLVETGMIISVSEISVPSPSTARVELSDTVIDVRRAAWKDADNHYRNLWQTDDKALTSFVSSWDSGTPEVYSRINTPLVSVQLQPSPLDVGSLHLLTVDAGQALDLSGVILGIPDDYAWVIKYGALCDLFSQDGLAKDPLRADYCETRWKEGVELARIAGSLMNAEINGVPCQLTTLNDLDVNDSSWQHTSGEPSIIAVVGFNLIALSSVPDGIYSVVGDVVRNCPLPVNDADPLQVGREYIDALLDYAVHVAMLKVGGGEFGSTIGAYQRVLRLAAIHNERLRAQADNFDSLSDTNQDEQKERPRRMVA